MCSIFQESRTRMTKQQAIHRPLDKAAATSRLTTFRPPTPSPGLIRALAPINRWLMLGGVPGLRQIPVLGSVPGLRGIMNVPELDFPCADKERLKVSVNPSTAAFVTPNHPEFLTDWMLDKEVLSRAAPLVASWATHEIVNGLGPRVQKFWLKNNLIAQIPGAGGQSGKEYSVAWARKGNGVLLHPEGSVGWHGDLIGQLFPGAAEMALQAERQISEAGEARPVYIAPVVWKLFFTKDVTRGLHKELSYIEKSLHLPKRHTTSDPATRLYLAYDALLSRDEVRYQVHPTDAPYFTRRDDLEARLLERLDARLTELVAPAADDATAGSMLRRSARWLRSVDKTDPEAHDVRRLTKDITKLRRMRRAFYGTELLSQEHVAECIKRIRNDYCRSGLRNNAHNYVPVPVGPRRAVIRVPEPIEVKINAGQSATMLTDALRRHMQSRLDRINADNAAQQSRLPYFPNPFL